MDGDLELADSPCPGRDVVWFFANLTKTLEEYHGGEWLGARLAGLRRAPAAGEPRLALEVAGGRFLRRMGYVKTLDEAKAFIGPFAAYLAKAVSRSPEYVCAVINLFAHGDQEAGKRPVCGATPLCQSRKGVRCQLTKDCDYYNSPRAPVLAASAPAERLLGGLDGTLSDAELLSVALFGDKATGVEPLTVSLFKRYGKLRAIFAAENHEYEVMREIKPAQTLRLAAFAVLHRRVLREKRGAVLQIATAKDFYDRYAAELRGHKVGAAVLVLLDHRNNVIRDAWFCDIPPSVARLEMADLMRPVIQESASSIALVHNHPSGDPAPSPADRDFTRRLKSACGVFGFVLVDHVIITENGYFSFDEEGLLGAL
ncbi:MAG: hypothetical protein LBJ46_01670 [Planctomycetota bacterium]|jgi:DNA repair protein RadC|nr:hypothetical protein [Planctomycetota bacterium]